MLGAGRRAVSGVVVGQGVLGEELVVIFVVFLWFDELTDLVLCGFSSSLGWPLIVSSPPDGLRYLEGGLGCHNPGRCRLEGWLVPQLEG